MRLFLLALLLTLFAVPSLGQQRLIPDGRGGWIIESGPDFSAWGPDRSGARQVDIDRQNAALMQEMIRQQQLNNELLRRKLEQERSATQTQGQQPPPVDYTAVPEFRAWQADNAWFGSDRARTEFAVMYAKQLRQERPDLVGRPFLDTVTAKISATFAGTR